MKVYITKYALTEGIIESEAREVSATMIEVKWQGWNITFHKPHWHDSLEIAKEKASEMRLNKLKSIQKQTDKINKLDFSKIKTK